MEQTLSSDEVLIIEENAAYVLGMYELYPNDKDILAAIRSKGIKEKLIPFILQKIKTPAYEKRLQQARRNIVMGILLTTLFSGLYFFFIHLPQANTLLQNTRPGDGPAIFTIKIYRQIFYLFFVAAIMQFVVGIQGYFKFRSLLHSNKPMLPGASITGSK